MKVISRYNSAGYSSEAAEASESAVDRILVVDADASMRNTIRLALCQHGYSVDEASSVEKACSMTLDDYSMLVIDMKMEHMAGLKFTRQIRQSSYSPLIIICSTKESEHDIVIGLDAGADDYITRKLNVPMFVARVNALLRRRQRCRY